MNARKVLLPLLLLLSFCTLVYHLYQLSQPAPVKRGAGAPPEYRLKDVTWTRFAANGQPILQGDAAQLSYYDDARTTGRNLQIVALRPGGAPWTASAPRGLMPAGSHRILLRGRVQIQGRWPDDGQPLTINTTHLWINPGTHELNTAAPVTLDSPGRHAWGTGLSADWLAQNVSLHINVKMLYDAPKH